MISILIHHWDDVRDEDDGFLDDALAWDSDSLDVGACKVLLDPCTMGMDCIEDTGGWDVDGDTDDIEPDEVEADDADAWPDDEVDGPGDWPSPFEFAWVESEIFERKTWISSQTEYH